MRVYIVNVQVEVIEEREQYGEMKTCKEQVSTEAAILAENLLDAMQKVSDLIGKPSIVEVGWGENQHQATGIIQECISIRQDKKLL